MYQSKKCTQLINQASKVVEPSLGNFCEKENNVLWVSHLLNYIIKFYLAEWVQRSVNLLKMKIRIMSKFKHRAVRDAFKFAIINKRQQPTKRI